MTVDRRGFFKLAGLGALGLAGARSLPVLGNPLPSPSPPESGPPSGVRWGMVVDLRACLHDEGCQDCILACDHAHNIPQLPDRKHEVKWIWKDPYEEVFPMQAHEYLEDALRGHPALAFCNHCNNPPCVRVCPTKATFRREDGLVMMDWHRCIGCRYCIAACPYGSRSFNWVDPRPYIEKIDPEFPTRTRGVVEKCNFCDERLARNEQPACVAACRNGAMTFGNLADPTSTVRLLLKSRYSIRRKPALGTHPEVFYLV